MLHRDTSIHDRCHEYAYKGYASLVSRPGQIPPVGSEIKGFKITSVLTQLGVDAIFVNTSAFIATNREA
jgi:hypothetical protein